MKRKQLFPSEKLLILLILVLLAGCGSKSGEKLHIATAANMQFAMEALTQAFTATTGIACETIISSSGKLTAQITEGAPFDVFVSADLKYPQALVDVQLTDGPVRVYAYGQLVLWTKKTTLDISIAALTKEEVRHIAMANPKTAPYGVAAAQVLSYYQLTDTVQPKLVFGESIAQTNQFIISQAAEIGFTARSVVEAPILTNKGRWMALPNESYEPIAQGVVVLKGNEEKVKQAQQFADFLLTAEAKNIMIAHGYLVPDSTQLQ
ncbi:molybdate ABC transporter substrate-binding protein [Lewinella cohaerens]|uniref:molybdate ABC transporter substrate-binding protein n=1 Tax=Lewinella cohaerens TaxID=70995 RepID=UPI000378CB46|nr:molybdate ABC transporter substrate-binding protein [Lewinella cohaerens]